MTEIHPAAERDSVEPLFQLPTAATARRKGIGGHHTASATEDDWLTPPEILRALGEFDLDPCASERMPWRTAKVMLSWRQHGLSTRWPDGARVWLNPPYSQIERWMGRMAGHGHGTAIVFARTETEWFFTTVWDAASAVLFLRGRPHFCRPDGTRAKGNSGGPVCLVAYGDGDAVALRQCGLAGHLAVLPRRKDLLEGGLAVGVAGDPRAADLAR
jgi:phage N-6-adenine-methyltransferase